ncbi:MAG: serine/threonine protein kinase [Deltaproteobacteria bacterium]|nr:MAG: serine/threonine protein kinase [Deltaproteobacteria bacterium]
MMDRPGSSARPSGGGSPLDRYVVLEYLAEGGMGAIYLGKKLGAGGFEKEVVLKQLLPEFTQQPEFIDLFLREARLSATLDHANIIHTIDLVTAGDEYFIVMEYLPGADLRTLLKRAKRRRKRMSPAAGIFVAREVLSALAYAHAKRAPDGRPLRLIHRDISPSNILISRNGEVKLTDFGIAKASTHNSVFYRVKGKVGYMSPEQARSEPLDSRSDLYSLAVCLYEMVTGERLFVQAGLTTSADDLYSRPVPMVSRKVEGVPAEFDKVMLKALSIDPRARYQTAGEFQEALLRVAHRHGLMMSAPELADHLRDVCGDPDRWRDIDAASHPGLGGTELYEPGEGTARIGVSEVDIESDADLVEVLDREDTRAVINLADVVQRRAQTSLTHLTQLKGLELTSMINLADDGEVGAKPLVDFDTLAVDAGDDTGDSDVVDLAGANRGGRATGTRAPAVEVAGEASGEIDGTGLADELEPAPASRRWLVLMLIVLLGVGIAAAIGLTGPELPPPATPGDRPGPAGAASP